MALDWRSLERALSTTSEDEVDCQRALEEIPALLDEPLDAEFRVELEAHLARCGCCREEVAALLRALGERAA